MIKKFVLLLLLFFTITYLNAKTLKNLTYKPGQKEITSIISAENIENLKIQVLEKNNPLKNIKVYFHIISAPTKSKKHKLYSNIISTDTNGIAEVKFKPDKVEGKYEIAAFVPELKKNPIVFTISTKKNSWLYFLFASLIGGTTVFLFGMTLMSDGLQNFSGSSLSNIVEKYTSNRFSGLLVGTIITAIIQSSSATTVIAVGLINGGIMQFSQSIGIILGANIGTTITAQIVAFKLTDFALIIIAAGFFVKILAKSKKKKMIGEIILGFGILFFGIKIMSDLTKPLYTYQPFIDILLKLENPIIGVIAGAIFTALIRSSSAATGVYIALSFQGLMTLEAAIPLIFGANIGTSTNALIASIGGNRDAKRAALAHTIFNVSQVIVFLPFIDWYHNLIFQMSPSPENLGTLKLLTAEHISMYTPRQIANAHTISKIIAVIAVLPFTKYLAKLCEILIPDKNDESDYITPKYLDKKLIKYPTMAISVAHKEVLRMGGFTLKMIDYILEVLEKNNIEYAQKAISDDENIDILYKQLIPYLSEISEEKLSDKDALKESSIFLVAEELENIGDIVSKNIIPNFIKLFEESLTFESLDYEHIKEFHNRIKNSLQDILAAFRTNDLKTAKKILQESTYIKNFYTAVHITHLKKYRAGVTESIKTSTIYLEVISNLKQIYSLIINIAQIMKDYFEKKQNFYE